MSHGFFCSCLLEPQTGLRRCQGGSFSGIIERFLFAPDPKRAIAQGIVGNVSLRLEFSDALKMGNGGGEMALACFDQSQTEISKCEFRLDLGGGPECGGSFRKLVCPPRHNATEALRAGASRITRRQLA